MISRGQPAAGPSGILRPATLQQMPRVGSVRRGMGVPVKQRKGTQMNQTVTNIMKWSAIPALLLISMLSRFTARFEFPVDIVICMGATVLLLRAFRQKAYFWAGGCFLIAVVFSPMMLAVKLFLVLGAICTGIFWTTLSVFRLQLATAAQRAYRTYASL